MTNTISQGKMLSLVFLIKETIQHQGYGVLGKLSITCEGCIITFERPCNLSASLDKKLRGTRDIPLKVILGWTGIYTGGVQGSDVQDSKKFHSLKYITQNFLLAYLEEISK